MSNFLKRILIEMVFCALLATEGTAQTSNYWSWSSNTNATLMGGAVVGGEAGPSAIFFNPALINHNKEPSLALSANLISFQLYNVHDIAGENLDADMFFLKVQPRFVSLVLPTKNKRLGIQMALLSPTSETVEYSNQYQSELEIIQRTAGNETYNGYLRYERDYNDTWGGMGLSYQMSDRLYLGGSLFLSYKSLDLISIQSSEAYQNTDSVAVAGDILPRYISTSGSEEDFSYWFWSGILKLGIQYTTLDGRLNMGMSVTLPNIPIYGEADVRKRYYRSNIYDNAADEFVANENTLGVIEGGKVNVKSPFSLAVGGTYHFKNKTNILLFTAEYFGNVAAYRMVDSDMQADWIPGYVSQNIKENSFMSYAHQARPVTNVAIGFQSVISEKLSYLGGFRTDFTIDESVGSRYVNGIYGVNQIQMNKWHLTSGVLLEILQFKLNAGLQYSLGRAEGITQGANYSNPEEYNPDSDQSLGGDRKPVASASLNDLTLFFGLAIGVK